MIKFHDVSSCVSGQSVSNYTGDTHGRLRVMKNESRCFSISWHPPTRHCSPQSQLHSFLDLGVAFCVRNWGKAAHLCVPLLTSSPTTQLMHLHLLPRLKCVELY